jgi:hypothetical protein
LVRPLYLTHANDQSNRLFVVEQGGKVYVMGTDGAFNTFMDVSNLISVDALNPNYTERGLLGLAFHPHFASNGAFFINYTEANTHDTIVARYRVSADDPNRADLDQRGRVAPCYPTLPQPQRGAHGIRCGWILVYQHGGWRKRGRSSKLCPANQHALGQDIAP